MVGCSNPASEDYSDVQTVVPTPTNGGNTDDTTNPTDNPTNAGEDETHTNGESGQGDTPNNGSESGNTSGVTENIVTFTIHNNINNSTKTITRNENDIHNSYYYICKDELIDNNLVSDINSVINGNLKTVTNITRNFSKLAYTNGNDVDTCSRLFTTTENGVIKTYYRINKKENNLLKVMYNTTTTKTVYTKEPSGNSEIIGSNVFNFTDETRLLTLSEYKERYNIVSDCSVSDTSGKFDYVILEDGNHTFKFYQNYGVEISDDSSEPHFYVYYTDCYWKQQSVN